MSRKPQLQKKTTSMPSTIPVLAIRNRVLFPKGFLRLSIGKPKSVTLVESEIWNNQRGNMKKNVMIGVFTRRPDQQSDGDEMKQLFEIGTAARVVQIDRAKR
jgi:ATP-dependent Lon protease